MKFGCSRLVIPLIVQRITVGVQRKPTVSQFRVRSPSDQLVMGSCGFAPCALRNTVLG